MKLLKLVLKYIKYYITSKAKYSIQGPFLYELTTQVIKKRITNKSIDQIETLRKKLCRSEKEIEITDFGAGSKINRSKKRKIKDIAKNSSKNSKFGKLLYKIVDFYKPKNIIELGTSLGVSALYLAKASDKAQVFTFEGCPKTAQVAFNNFKEQDAKNISIVTGNFDSTLTKKLNQIGYIDLAFIDGNHTEKATIKYFKQCLDYSHNNTIFIFDDIHWSKGMEKAWEYIKNHEKTTLTVNLFFVGLVFIKSELSKENFTIRF